METRWLMAVLVSLATLSPPTRAVAAERAAQPLKPSGFYARFIGKQLRASPAGPALVLDDAEPGTLPVMTRGGTAPGKEKQLPSSLLTSTA